MVECKHCHKIWDYEEEGLSCPACHTPAEPDAAEIATLFQRAVALEQDKKYSEAFARYAMLATLGERSGEEAYALCLARGRGVARDLARAADAYLIAAEHGSVRAAASLGLLLLRAPRLETRRGSAALWLRTAAALGNREAAYTLYARASRLGVLEEERLAYLSLAARLGDTRAARRLALYYLSKKRGRDFAAARHALSLAPARYFFLSLYLRLFGEKAPEGEVSLPTVQDTSLFLRLGAEAAENDLPATALRLDLLAEEAGSAEGAMRAGTAYSRGIGVPADVEAAIYHYRLAAERGSAEAALLLARIYERDRGDLAEAERFYQRAAERGGAEHQYILGEFYLLHDKDGEGVRRAVPCLRRAATGGCTPATERLRAIDARLCETYNRAVAAQAAGDVRTAFELYKSGAALGHAASLSNLGYCLQKGLGCTQDARAAAAAYREAVAAGSLPAHLNLAALLVTGAGIRRDYSAARALLLPLGGVYREHAETLIGQMDEAKKKKKAERLYSYAAAAYHRGDVQAALHLRLEAAKAGSPRASYMIGCHFEFGDGVALDRTRAAAFYSAAAEVGFTGDRARLKSGYLREHRRLHEE